MRRDLPPRGNPSAAWFGAALPPAELSIELFPPKTPEAAARLERALPSFVAAGPSFISVTCGAGDRSARSACAGRGPRRA